MTADARPNTTDTAAGTGLSRLVADSDADAEARKADIKAAAQDIYGGTFPNGFSTRVGRVTARGNETIVEGFVFADVDGKQKRVGKFVRGFQRQPDGSVWATHEEIAVDRDYQGSGFALAFNAQAEDWYRANGVDRIRLLANKDVGAYAWARAGYDWDSEDSARKVLERVGRVMRLIDADSRIPDERKAGQADLARRFLERAEGLSFGDDGFPTPYEVSQLGRWDGAGRDDFWIGKSALWGASWNGVRPLAREGDSARIRRLDDLGQWHNEWSGDVISRAEANYDPAGHPDDTDLNVHAQDWFADGGDEDRYAERADTIVGGSWLDDDGPDEPTTVSQTNNDDGPPSAPQEADPEQVAFEAVLSAYRSAQSQAGGQFGDWAGLVRIRREMAAAGMSREEQDEALRIAANREGANLVPENNQKALTADDRAAALHFGGQDKHLIAFDRTFAVAAEPSREAPADAGGATGPTGAVARNQDALDAAPATLTPGPESHFGNYDGERLDGPDGMGSVRALSEYVGVEYEYTNGTVVIDTGIPEVDAVASRHAARLPQVVQRALNSDEPVRVEELTGDHADDVAYFYRNQMVVNASTLTPAVAERFEARRAEQILGDDNGAPMLDHVIAHEFGHGVAYQLTPAEIGDVFDTVADNLDVDRPRRNDNGAAFLAAWIVANRQGRVYDELLRAGGHYGVADWEEWLAEVWAGYANGSTNPLTQMVGRLIEDILDRPGRQVQPWPET